MKKLFCRFVSYLYSKVCVDDKQNLIEDSIEWGKLWSDIQLKEKVEFTYNNAIELLKEIEINKSELRHRALLLMTYLFTITSVLFYFSITTNLKTITGSIIMSIFKKCTMHICDPVSILLIIVCYFSILSCFSVWFFIMSNSSISINQMPEKILKNITQYSIEKIKAGECISINNAIKYNIKTTEKYACFLNLIGFFSILPVLVFTIYYLYQLIFVI